MFDCLFFVCKYSMFQGEPDQIFDLIKKLILKDPQKRLTAVQTLDVAQKQLAQMYVYYFNLFVPPLIVTYQVEQKTV